MRARANNETPMTGKDWLALFVVCAVVIWIVKIFGPALDAELGFVDERAAAHQAECLVAQGQAK